MKTKSSEKPAGKSKYAQKHAAQLKGDFYNESPLPEYRVCSVVIPTTGKIVKMKAAI